MKRSNAPFAAILIGCTANACAVDLPPMPATSAPIASETAVAPIHAEKILFRGNKSIAFEELAAVAHPFEGKRLDAADIEELRRRLTQLYVDRGFVNSGARLAPETRDQVLVFEIVEGRLASIRLHGMGRLADSYVADRLVPDLDAAFNIDRLRERFQLLLNDPLFARMNGRVMPGDRPGESIFDVDVTRARPYSLTLYANDYRPPSIGAEAVGLRGWVRNLTGHGDALEGTLEEPSGFQNVSTVDVRERIPIGARGPSLELHYGRGNSAVVEQPLANLGIHSILETRDIGMTQLVRETLRQRWTIGASRVWRTNRTFLLGEPFSFIPGEPDGATHTRSWNVWQEFTQRTEQQAFVIRAVGMFVKSNVRDEGFLSVPVPGRHYTVWQAQGQYVRQPLDGTTLSARALIQYAPRLILPLDQLPIGGVNTVRGYRENQFLRQNAAVMSVELQRVVRRDEGDGRQLSLGPFVDYGHGTGGGASTVKLWSAGLAGHARWNAVTANLAIGSRLSHSRLGRTEHRGLQDYGVHAEIAFNVF